MCTNERKQIELASNNLLVPEAPYGASRFTHKPLYLGRGMIARPSTICRTHGI